MKFLVWIVFYCFLASSNLVHGQSIKKDKSRISSGAFNYYRMEPEVKVRGIVILLTGTGESPQSVFNKTSLPKLLAEKGYVTIIPMVHNLLIADQYSLEILDTLFKTQAKKYGVANFVIGGLSSGGAIATRYAEYLLAKDSTNNNLKGLMAIDPPLDLERVYASAERKIEKCDGLIRKEGYFIKDRLDDALGGSPKDQSKNYLKHSSYLASAADGGNAKYLKNLAIRLYSEPDLDFVQKTYCSELQFDDINARDLARLAKFLSGIGNTRSEYITTKGKGFHSWNIVDPTECTNWIVSITQEN